MSIDHDVARRIAALDRPAAEAILGELDLMTPDGLDQLLDAAAALARDDPAIGARLAQLAGSCAADASAPAAKPRAAYLQAQAEVAAGNLPAALTLIDAARLGFDRLGLVADALRTNLGRSQVLNEMGRHVEALDAVGEILGSADVLGDPTASAVIELLAAAHQNSGLCLELSGRPEESLDHYASAALGYASIGATRAIAEVAYDRGLVLLTIGQHAAALDALQHSVAAFREGGYRALLAMALTNTAEVHLHRGEYQLCLDALDEAQVALADISSPVGHHVSLLVAARAYLALNLLPEALTSFSDALEFLDGTEMAVERARARWGLGLALARLGRYDEAADALARAARQFEHSGHAWWLADLSTDRAGLLHVVGDEDGALQVAAHAVSVAPAGTSADARARLMLNSLQHGAAALQSLGTLVADIDSLALAPLVAVAHHALGRRLAGAGRLEEAERSLRTAVEMIERLRSNLTNESTLTRFLDDKRSPYEDLLDVLVRRGSAGEIALAVGEQAKSRTLSDVVSGLTPFLVAQAKVAEDDIDADLRGVYGELFAGQLPPDSDRSQLLQRRLHDLEARRDLTRLNQAGRSRRTLDARPAPPPTSTTPGTAMISYALAGDDVHAFVVIGTEVTLQPNIASWAAINADLSRLRRHFERFRLGPAMLQRHLPQLEQSTRSVLGALYRLLIAPVEPLLPEDIERLIIVPDGALLDVPFHALWDGQSHLLERFEMTYTPSIDTLRHLPQGRHGSAMVVGVADEFAPTVEAEALGIARFLPDATVLVGAAARWNEIEAGLDGLAHLHIGGHALFRPDNPMYSAIKVADRWVTAADLYGLDLGGATVVLSACDTARTHEVRSSEVNGFIRGFLGAGAATVVASQWTADDRATSEFMDLFYAGLASAGPATALRSAQLALAADYAHPYYWAPWIVVGRGGPIDAGA
jgi:tetratricopeptide (TPR) repeat protein